MLNPRGISRHLVVLIGGDFSLAFGAAWPAAFLSRMWNPGGVPAGALPAFAILFGLLSVGAMYLRDLYALEQPRTPGKIARAVLGGEAIVALALPIILFFIPQLSFGRRFFAGYFILVTPALGLWRISAMMLMAERLKLGVAIIGIGEDAALVASEIRRRAHLGYRFSGFIVRRDQRALGPPRAAAELVRQVASLSELPDIPSLAVIVIAPGHMAAFPARELIAMRVRGIVVEDLESFYERMTGRLPTDLLREDWLALAPGFRRTPLRAILKRAVDIAAASLLALAAAPVAALTALAIKLDSPGPVLYSQERTGLDGQSFRVRKFRSMRTDAEKDTGAVCATVNDPRVTRVGRYIRKLRVDELPQLYNVLAGDMSLIGPRPERPEMVARFAQQIPFYAYRHMIRPGLSGWAQVCYPYGAGADDAREKLCYDLYYMKNWSIAFDLQIALQTVKVVLFGRGAR